MKATIYITGQIGGNFRLRSAIDTAEAIETTRTMFNGFAIVFPTKKAAISAMRAAYNWLAADEEDRKGSIGGVRATKNRTEIYYDASKAVIQAWAQNKIVLVFM